MSGRVLAFTLALALLGAGLILAPVASAEMEAPTISAQPALNAEIEEAEWANSKSFEFASPRLSEKSTVRMGYHANSGELALGFVLADQTAQDDDELVVYVSTRELESDTDPEREDQKFVVQGDGDWEYFEGNGSAFPTRAQSSGSSPSSTNSDVWNFAVEQEAVSTWVVEMTIDIGDFEAGDKIRLGFEQTDVNDDDEEKTTKRPSGLNAGDVGSWEDTILSGRPTDLNLRLRPSDLEAGVGADVTATLPSDATGGRLTVSVKAPGDSGFAPIGTKDPGRPGANTFFFAPEKVGTYQIKAEWQGDENYQSKTSTTDVKVSRPTAAGPTVLETGSMRVAFPLENEGVEAAWEYLNTRVTATDENGDPLDLVRLDGSNSCRGSPWVGIANTDEGSVTLHFDPPVNRSAVALTSPQGSFSATWETHTVGGDVTPETGSGSCKDPVFANVGDIDDRVEKLEISYTGDDTREVVDVAFANPVVSTPPKTMARSEPSPLHPSGSAEVIASAGSPHRLISLEATVKSGSTTVATETCDRPSGQTWIDCRIPVTIPSGTGSLQVEIESTDRFGMSFTATETLKTTQDHQPPKASLLPRPMLAPPGGAVSVMGKAWDASGMQSITIRSFTSGGETLLNETCSATQTDTRQICKVAVSPEDGEVTFVEATYTDLAGNSVTVGPKPVPIRGDDKDGDGLPDDLEREIGTSLNQTDTDGDGLSDGWEVVGADRSGDGTPELDLAARGADPLVRDLFLEVDWAEHDGHSHEVSYGALQVLRNTFAAHGIRVHTDISEEGGPFDPTRFDHGHEVHRHLMDPARAGIYMHVVAGHMGGPAASGGWTIYLPTGETTKQIEGRVGAQLIHEVGHHLGLGHGGGGTQGTGDKATQAAFAEDYKPNYLSVMNNAYAWGIVVDTTEGLVRVPTYAGMAIDDLDESSLDEPTGTTFNVGELHASMDAGPVSILEENTITGLRLRYTCPGEGALVKWTLAPQPVDWNCNGGSSDTGVKADINRGGANSGTSKLYSRTDWEALSLAGPSCPQYALMITDEADTPGGTSNHEDAYAKLGLAPCPLQPSPATPLDKDVKSSIHDVPAPDGGIEEADGRDNDGDGKVDDGFADEEADGVVNLIDGCPLVPDGAQTDLNRNGQGDRCEGPVAQLSNVRAVGTPGGVQVSWSKVEGVWGYNVYRLSGDAVDQVGSGTPSTTDANLIDGQGSEGDRYLVRGVNTLLDQGPATIVTATGATGGADGGTGDGGTDGNGSDTPQEGVPSPGALAAAVAAGLAAVMARRRRG